MKLSKIVVLTALPAIALTISNSPNSQVQAMPVSQCIQGCIAGQALGSKWCSLTWINPAAYSACMLGVSGVFTACCINCGTRGQ